MLRLKALLVLLALALGAGCTRDTSLPGLSVSLVTPDGKNPVTNTTVDRVRVLYREGDVPFEAKESTVANGSFDLVLPMGGYDVEHELRYELYSGTTLVALGATPPFYPAQSLVVRSVVASPETCAVVALPPTTGGDVATLPRGRKDFAAVYLAGYYALVGGSDASGITTKVDYVDGIRTAPAYYTRSDLPVAPGRARSTTVSFEYAIILSEGDSPFVYGLFGPYHTPVTLHDGAGYESAAVSLGEKGAAVVGGAAGVREVSFVAFASASNGVPTFTVTGAKLAFVATERAVTATSGAVLAASRSGTDVSFERVAPGATDATMLGGPVADGVRNGAILVASPGGDAALLLGGTDASGTPRTDTVWLHGCPSACVTDAGPIWTNPRTGVSVDASGVIVGGDPPSTLVEKVSFDATSAQVEAVGTLARARRAPGLVVLPSGVVHVLAGEGTTGPLADFEQCMPLAF